jgi:hypothetical protein
MSEAAKVKAGISSVKRRTKKLSPTERIRELEACIATMENPDEAAAVSKEPLIS